MLRPLLALLLLLAAVVGRADYVLTGYSGTGHSTYYGYDTPYELLENGWWGSYYTAHSYSGTIKAHFEWQGDDDPPPVAIVEEECASFIALGGGGDSLGRTITAVASDGLGHTDGPRSGDQGVGAGAGTGSTPKYTVKQNPGLAFDADVRSPSASLSPAPFGTIFSGVAYRASATALRLTFSGPVDPATAPKLAIGQKLNASVSGAPSSATYTWSMPSDGAPFANYVASASSAAYTGWTAPAGTEGTMSCYFAQPGSSTISCTVHAPSLNADVIVTRSLAVANPEFHSDGPSFGAMDLLVNGTQDPYAFLLNVAGGLTLTGTTTAAQYGISVPSYVTDPSFLNPGSGVFGYVQLKDSSLTTTTGASTVGPVHSTGLDLGFPYHRLAVVNGQPQFVEGWLGADGVSPYNYSDAPGVYTSGFVPMNTPTSGSYSGNFKLYLMYKPQDDDAGTSVYVPLFRLDWTAMGHFNGPSSGNFTSTDDGSSIAGADVYPAFPLWP